MLRIIIAFLLWSGLSAALAQDALADVWSFRDSDGILHFTNIKPAQQKAQSSTNKSSQKNWQRIRRESAPQSKVFEKRGDCERCDRVPAKDRSPDRFTRFDPIIFEAARLYELPVALIRAVIKVESDYDPRVVSAFGARGLMQLMPAVVKDMGVEDVHDPRQNILGGTRLLRVLANRYHGNLELTIAAYHAGVGSLAKYDNQVPPYFHTRKYLGMVLQRYKQYGALK